MEAVYARQSVEKKNSISIEGQIDLCRKTAGSDLKVYQDRGYSGKNTERPAFQQLMRDIQSGKITKLYVYRLDRFSRSVADFGRLWETLREHHVEFVSVSENFDTSTPMGRAMLHIIMVFAQLERETTAERVKDNYYRRASLGAWPGGPAPHGFSIGRCSSPDGRLVPSLIPNDHSATILRIYQEYALEEASLGSVAKKLNSDGIPAPKRSTWDNVSLSRILHNPAYVMADEQVYLYLKSMGCNVTTPKEDFDGVHGILLVGKRNSSERKYTDVRDHSASVLNSVGFITSDLWLSCQYKLANNRQIGNSGRGTHTWLSGLLKCAKCGYSLKVQTEKERKRLYCSGRYNLFHCDASISVDAREIEEQAEAIIISLLAEAPDEPLHEDKSDPLAKQLEELDRKADRLVDAFSESCDISSSYLHRALARIEEERQAILASKKRERSRPSFDNKLDFTKLSFEEKKVVAAQYIRQINVDKDSVEFIWNV